MSFFYNIKKPFTGKSKSEKAQNKYQSSTNLQEQTNTSQPQTDSTPVNDGTPIETEAPQKHSHLITQDNGGSNTTQLQSDVTGTTSADLMWYTFIPICPTLVSSYDIISISVVCNSWRKMITPHLERNFFFRLSRKSVFKTLRITRAVINSVFEFPPHITHLTFDDEFNKLVPSILSSSSVTHLNFGRKFNQPIQPASLPSSITHLIFGEQYNQASLEFPPNLLSLTFGCPFFSRPINNLPPSLLHLSFNNFYPYSILNFPPNLVRLENYTCRSPPLTEVYPPTLTHLTTYEVFPLIDKNIHLTHLAINMSNVPLDPLPPTLTHFTLMASLVYTHPLDSLPPQLTYLSIVADFNLPLTKIPSTLTHLILGTSFNQPLNDLPSNLRYLVFGRYHLSPTPFYFPYDSKPERHFIKFQCRLSNLPSSLTHLIFGYVHDPINIYAFHAIAPGTHRYEHKIPLPPSLHFLYLGKSYAVTTSRIQAGPNSLRYYSTGNPDDVPCHHLTHLQLFSTFSHLPPHGSSSPITHLCITLREHTKAKHLPPTLRHLTVYSSEFQDKLLLSDLPSLSHFIFLEGRKAKSASITLPPSLTHLFLSENFRAKLLIPPSLTHLAIGQREYRHITSPLPLSLRFFAFVTTGEIGEKVVNKNFIPSHTRVKAIPWEDLRHLLPLFYD